MSPTLNPDEIAGSNELLPERIKSYLLERIVRGDLQPGERIVELRLAKKLGTSQSPIREAVRDLSALGLVEITPRRGARVRKLDAKELADVSLLRSEVDALAARLAADSTEVDHLVDMRRHLNEMKSLASTTQIHDFSVADAAFHGVIARASGNKAVERVFNQLEPIGRTYIAVTLPNVDLASLITEHEDILAHVASGNTSAAAEAARSHQLHAATRMVASEE